MSELISNDKVKARFIDDLGTLMMGVYSMMLTKASIPLNYN